MQSSKLPTPFFYLLAVFCLLLFLGFTGVFRPMRGLMEKTLAVPLKEKAYQWQRFFKKDLGSCLLKERKELAELKTKIVSLSEENKELRRLLSSPLPRNWQFLPAKVIDLEGETLVIGSGRQDGISLGMLGVEGNTYLGKITEVSEKMAKLRLPSSWEERLAVKVVGREEVLGGSSKAKGLLIGRGQGKMRLEQILSSEVVENADLVITNIEGGDLLVGEVEEVIQAKGEVFKSAMVKRLFNPEELETIFLIRGKL